MVGMENMPLPNKILVNVFRYLSTEDHVICSQVSKRLNDAFMNRLVPVKISIPAQPGNHPTSQSRAVNVHVPAHARQQGPTRVLLHPVLRRAIDTAINLPQDSAERHFQSQINNAFANRPT